MSRETEGSLGPATTKPDLEKCLCPFTLLMQFRMSEEEENSETDKHLRAQMGKLRPRVGRRHARDLTVTGS